MINVNESKPRSRLRTTMVLGFRVILLAALVWIGWEFRPWMPEGRMVHVVDAHFGNRDFQVWQRKNSFDDAAEPFETGLFVRKADEPWKAYLLDIQDTYRPSITLREETSGVVVLYGKDKRAYFDENLDAFTLYHSDGGSDVRQGFVIDSEPPDDWWQRVTGH